MVSHWCAITPITYYGKSDELLTPFEFEKGVVLSLLPDWFNQEKFLVHLDEATRRNMLGGDIRFAFMVEYWAEALGSPDPEWQGDEDLSIQIAKYDAITLANLALWLAKPTSLGFNVLFHLDKFPEEKNIRWFSQVDRIIPHFMYENEHLTLDSLNRAKKMHKELQNLPRKGSLRQAVYSLYRALTSTDWSTRYLLVWIALEALFGPEDGRELSFRISQRLGFFLSSKRSEAEPQFKKAKRGYDWRSKVVHGMRLSKLKTEESGQISFDGEDLINTALSKILINPKLIKVFNGKERENYLDSLPYQS